MPPYCVSNFTAHEAVGYASGQPRRGVRQTFLCVEMVIVHLLVRKWMSTRYVGVGAVREIFRKGLSKGTSELGLIIDKKVT